MALQNIRQWGGATSNAILDPDCHFFTLPQIQGGIGYFSNDHTLIAMGDPVAQPSHQQMLAAAFQKYCKAQQLGYVYAITSADFAEAALQNGCGAIIEFCQELTLDTSQDPTAGSKGRLLRRKLRHTTRDGITVQEYLGYDELLEKKLDAIGDAWLQKRKGPQIHISHIHLFDNRFGKRWFYATRGSDLIGVLVISELKAKKGWLINHLMALPGENGVTELMVMFALNRLANEGYRILSIGAMPAAKIGAIKGLGPLAEQAVRLIFLAVQKIFGLERKRKYWEKFSPVSQPAFCVLDRPALNIRTLLSLARVFNVSL